MIDAKVFKNHSVKLQIHEYFESGLRKHHRMWLKDRVSQRAVRTIAGTSGCNSAAVLNCIHVGRTFMSWILDFICIFHHIYDIPPSSFLAIVLTFFIQLLRLNPQLCEDLCRKHLTFKASSCNFGKFQKIMLICR